MTIVNAETFSLFLIRYFLILHFKCYPKSPPYPSPQLPYPPTPIFWSWRSPVLGLIKFACPMSISVCIVLLLFVLLGYCFPVTCVGGGIFSFEISISLFSFHKGHVLISLASKNTESTLTKNSGVGNCYYYTSSNTCSKKLLYVVFCRFFN